MSVNISSRGSYFFDIVRNDPGFRSGNGNGLNPLLGGSGEEGWNRPLPSLYD